MASNKDKFGEVFTPPSLVHQMIDDTLSLMGDMFFHHLKCIFEIGAGKGVFYDTLIHKRNLMTNPNGVYIMNEINPEHQEDLEHLIEQNANHKLLMGNILELDLDLKLDFVWGNLPFHNGGKSFVPGIGQGKGHGIGTNNGGVITIWPLMVKIAFDMLKDDGFFLAIIPCIWLKEDKAGIYDLFVRKHKLCFLKVFNCVQANKIFKYNCQTPICYVMVQKKSSTNINSPKVFKLYDSIQEKWINFSLIPGYCIPTSHVMLFQNKIDEIIRDKNITDKNITDKNKVFSCYDKIKRICFMKKSVLQYSLQKFDKKNIEKHGILQDAPSVDKHDNILYKVITGASIDKDKSIILHGVLSHEHGTYFGIPKLILPHKRLLYCFKDYDGSYSCHGRDMHVFLFDDTTIHETTIREKIDILADYLSSQDHTKMVENGFRIRMNFIEKYAFKYINYPI